jgi:hypothetical protein
MSTPVHQHKDHPPSSAAMRSHILNRQRAYFFFYFSFLLSSTNVSWGEGAGSNSHHLIIIHTSLRQIFNGCLNKTVLWNARNHPRIVLLCFDFYLFIYLFFIFTEMLADICVVYIWISWSIHSIIYWHGKFMNNCSPHWSYFAKHTSLYQCWYILAETFVVQIRTLRLLNVSNRSAQREAEE